MSARVMAAIEVTSGVFSDGDMLPIRYGCDGEGVSPPLVWTSVPDGAKSITVLLDDPDSPSKKFTHWILFNLPPDTDGIPENTPSSGILANHAKQGTNDAGKIGYLGPCPPGGTHRYIFHVYALDRMLDLQPGATKDQVKRAMQGHILAEGQLMAKYSRQ